MRASAILQQASVQRPIDDGPTATVVLFGIGSPIVVEHAETCRRLGWSIIAAIKNRDGDVYFDDPARIMDAGSVDPAVLAYPCLCPLFTPANRAVATHEAKARGFRFDAALIDPHAVVPPTADVGGGSFINAGCIVGAKVSMARHVLANRAASIGHHVRIGECASLGPGVIVGGIAVIEQGAMIGAGAIVLPKVKIGAFAVVGAGAVVTRDVAPRSKVVGNPARVVETCLTEFELPNGGASSR
jgi:sugar O-acyltransferase (sialic acid O-acetyltransferase NeuD family)